MGPHLAAAPDVLALQELVRCPVEWGADIHNPELEVYLLCLWRAVVLTYQIDQEALLLPLASCILGGDIFSQTTLVDEDIAPMRENIKRWRRSARCHYVKLVQPLQQLRMAGVETYSKHYPISTTDAEVIVESNRRPSLLFPRFTIAVQLELVWKVIQAAIAEAWNELRDKDSELDFLADMRQLLSASPIFRVKCYEPIGAVDGASSQYARFDLNFSSRVGHAYPISEAEYNRATQYQGRIPLMLEGLIDNRVR